MIQLAPTQQGVSDRLSLEHEQGSEGSRTGLPASVFPPVKPGGAPERCRAPQAVLQWIWGSCSTELNHRCISEGTHDVITMHEGVKVMPSAWW